MSAPLRLAATLTLALVTAVPASAGDADDYLSAEITPAMITGATVTLDPAEASIPLDAADATIHVEQPVEEKDESTVVRLTSDLLFAFGSADLSDPARAAITDIIADIPQGVAVAVDGHTDSIGDDAFNDDLSTRRAEAVAAVLRQTRPDLQLTVTGHGEHDLLVKEGGGDQAANRRVEITYVSQNP